MKGEITETDDISMYESQCQFICSNKECQIIERRGLTVCKYPLVNIRAASNIKKACAQLGANLVATSVACKTAVCGAQLKAGAPYAPASVNASIFAFFMGCASVTGGATSPTPNAAIGGAWAEATAVMLALEACSAAA